MFKSFLIALLLAAASTDVHAFVPCASGMTEMSVESVEGIFCVRGSAICISSSNKGACPSAQEGLKYGSYCGVVASGVYGCKALDAESVKTFQPWVDPNATPTPSTAAPIPAPSTAAPIPAPSTAAPTPTPNSKCSQGSSMSVEGVEGIFCVYGNPICSGSINTGTCPLVQDGLPYGSYCGIVSSGVYGCKVLDANTVKLHPQGGVQSVNPSNSTTSASVAPATSAPAPSTPAPASNPDCPNGGSPMSIEGVQKIFCVSGIACAANIATGNCPGKQDGIEFGSFCDVVRSGVYGCRAYVGDNNKKPESKIAPPRNCIGNAAGNTPVSIVGAMRDFCASEPICSGNRYGNCPGIQDGLDQDSVCSLISYSVHGCIFKA